MKYLMVALLLVMAFCVSGCVTAQQQGEINRATWALAEKVKELEKYEEKYKDIMAAVEAGTLSVGEGKVLFKEVKEDIAETKEAADEFAATLERLKSEGASGIDIATGIVLSLINIGGALLGVRVWRGGVNNRVGNIGAT